MAVVKINIKNIKTISYEKVVACFIILILLLIFLKVIQGDGSIIKDNTEPDLSKLELENEKYRDLGDNPILRVVIMTEGFGSIYHKNVIFTGEELQIQYGENWEESKSTNELQLNKGDDIFKNGSVKIKIGDNKTIGINSIKRSYGYPKYEGEFEIYSTEKGLVLVNELPLESYLRWVVPSEMPTSYELEALKAQAICARSYAYMQMQKISYEEYNAHMNDSVSYQVYNNLDTSEKTDQAILETAGEKVGIDGKVVTTYFYSTSSGHTTDIRAWGSQVSEQNMYLQGVPISDGNKDYESELPWYSWEIILSADTLEEILELNLDQSIGKLKDVVILEKGAGDVVLSIEFIGEKNRVTVEGENSIRKALGSTKYNIIKNDNKSTKGMSLLPSAFFTIESQGSDYVIKGGGLGHGIGMSQNGANEMAKQGIGYEEIIHTFYQNVELMY